MTYPCPFEDCTAETETSEDMAWHVRLDHEINFSGTEPAELEDLGIHPPPRPWHRKLQGRTVA